VKAARSSLRLRRMCARETRHEEYQGGNTKLALGHCLGAHLYDADCRLHAIDGDHAGVTVLWPSPVHVLANCLRPPRPGAGAGQLIAFSKYPSLGLTKNANNRLCDAAIGAISIWKSISPVSRRRRHGREFPCLTSSGHIMRKRRRSWIAAGLTIRQGLHRE
jgi:hypothetical protein